jgi:NAD(P)-dependent dehydrogenase (short-subunit alcohol dehydrogenase family)
MDLGIAGRTALVTGASTGIGRATAELLVAEGAVVLAADIAEQPLRELEASGDGAIEVIVADLSTLDGCRAVADAALGFRGHAPDILVNNAGMGRIRSIDDVTDADWHATFELNFFATQRLTSALLPYMRARSGAAVVNVISDLAQQPEPSFPDYSPSKAALANLTRLLAKEYAPDIRINAVNPGPIWTPLWSRPGGFLETIEGIYGKKGDDAVQALVQDRGIPMQRMGTPEEVASAIVFLASARASFITGSGLGVNGGTIATVF